MFLEEVANADNVFSVIFRTQLQLNLIHPGFQLISLPVERQRLA